MANPGSPINYTPGEIADAGWGPQQFAQYKVARENSIFGVDHKKDANGRPIEQGLGSASNQTENSLRWIGKNEGPEAERIAREKCGMLAGGHPSPVEKKRHTGNPEGLKKARAAAAAKRAQAKADEAGLA